MTFLACGLLLAGPALSQTQTNYQRILSFGPYPIFGSSPRGPLIEGSDRLLYGTTYAGGSNNLGTVFRIAKNGSGFAVLHSFANGDFPYGGVVEGTNGLLYGATAGGGSHNGGTIFNLDESRNVFSTVHDFDPTIGDGVAPLGALLKGSDGLFYGTCAGGGGSNLGTIFKLSADGLTYSILHNFGGRTNGNDGSSPAAGLLQGMAGSLYGTTQTGGSNDFGTIFKLNTDRSGYTVLHHFRGSPGDGRLPVGGLVQGTNGLLYGTTIYGGANNVGTVFRVDTNGDNYVIVKSFMTGAEGNQPLAELALGPDGALYGTTRYGGPNDGGVAFRLDPDTAAYTVLHSFLGTGGDGSQPFAGLLLGSDGAWYGSTFYGGDYATNNANGVLFRLFTGPARVTITSITHTPASVVLTFAGGAAGQSYNILASPNLSPTGWQSLGTRTAAIDGTFQFSEAGASGFSSRFYRASQR
jgi:uncharacterized repeat protein (TIGR03803 family)